MPNASIGGLVSGLDTATIINQLMQIEAISQTRLKQRVSSEELEVNALQTLNAKLASLATRAEDLTAAKSWAPLTAASSSEHVSAVAGTTAVASSLSFEVEQTATAHSLRFSGTAADGDTVVATPGTTLSIDRMDGSPAQPVEVGDGTLDSVVAAINAADAGVQATAVRTDSGYRLHIQSSTTGVDSDFRVTGIDQLGSVTPIVGTDARIRIGTDTLSSPTDTFTDVLTGVDVTISGDAVGQTVEISVTRDSKSMLESVQALVDAANGALSGISSLTTYEGAGGAAGLLAGNSTLRFLRDDLLSAVTAGVGGEALASLGIQVDRDGTITFDAEKFESAYESDPAGVAARFTAADGFATRLHGIADGASDSTTGTVTLAVKGRSSAIERMEDSIADWDVRLGLRRDALTRQYAALEVALGQLQNQSSWLAGQIAGLPKISSE